MKSLFFCHALPSKQVRHHLSRQAHKLLKWLSNMATVGTKLISLLSLICLLTNHYPLHDTKSCNIDMSVNPLSIKLSSGKTDADSDALFSANIFIQK